MVQSWINNPSANQGILLVNESADLVVRVDASEDTTVAFRPKLSVTYNTATQTPPPGTLQFSNTTYSVNENAGTARITVTRLIPVPLSPLPFRRGARARTQSPGTNAIPAGSWRRAV